MDSATLAQALTAAREAAAAAGEVIRHYWQQGVAVELKDDATPVTIADREAEQAIRKILQAALPQASIYGEEYGLDGERGGLMWLVDPLGHLMLRFPPDADPVKVRSDLSKLIYNSRIG